jgi:hypothetical protein
VHDLLLFQFEQSHLHSSGEFQAALLARRSGWL